MAKTKKFSITPGTSGLTVYAVVIQRDTGYYLNDADGGFAAAPADKYQEMSADANLGGRYAYDESRTVWADGPYEFVAYSQLGGAPAPLTDTLIAAGMFTLSGDRTVTASPPALVEYALCTLARVKTTMGIAEDELGEDDRLVIAINDATDRLESILNRRIVKRAAPVVEYHDGSDEDEDGNSAIWPREYPVESIADIVSLETGTYASRQAVDVSGLLLDRGRVIISPVTGLCRGTQANALTYAPGYTVAPWDLGGVASNLAQRLYWADKRAQAGDSDETAGGVTRRAKAEAFSAEDLLVINAYKRVQAGTWIAGKWAKQLEWAR